MPVGIAISYGGAKDKNNPAKSCEWFRLVKFIIFVNMIKKFDALTGFRALAASLVFLYHNRKYWRADLHPEILRLINEFHIGVSLFFVLSGFLLAYTYGDKPAQNKKEYFKYIIVRCGRILPLYWLILTAFYLDPEFGNLKFSFLTYSLLHGFSNLLCLDGIAQAWSLSVEFTFYLLLPLLCVLDKKKFLYLLLFLIGLFFVTWLTGVVWTHVNGNPNEYFKPIDFILKGTFAGRWIEFLAGMVLAKLIAGGSNKSAVFWRIKYKTFIGFIGIFLTAYLIGLFQPDIYKHGVDHPIGYAISVSLLPLFTVLLLAGLISEASLLQRFFSSKIMILLGNASFAFYLIHISYVSIKLRSVWLGPDRNFILLWIISIVLYLLYEKPVYKWIRSFAK